MREEGTNVWRQTAFIVGLLVLRGACLRDANAIVDVQVYALLFPCSGKNLSGILTQTRKNRINVKAHTSDCFVFFLCLKTHILMSENPHITLLKTSSAI